MHIAVDVKTNQLVSLRITDERTGDSKELIPLVEEAEKRRKVNNRMERMTLKKTSRFKWNNSCHKDKEEQLFRILELDVLERRKR